MKLDTVHYIDALAGLRQMADESVNCIVTSPPYFGLRAYLPDGHPDKELEIGLEPTPQEYVAALVTLFREARRVLRSDGVFFLNLGDSYANDDKWGGTTGGKHAGGLHGNTGVGRQKRKTGFKPKNRLMIPARVAIALQEDGWWLRDEIVWHKPAPMPASVTDRTTPAHEMVYLLTKAARYWFDAEAIREPFADERMGRDRSALPSIRNVGGRTDGYTKPNGIDPSANGGRNKRSVWTVSTRGFPEAHFATFPEKLIEPMILAGCPAQTCATCGAPYERQLDDRRSLDLSRPQAKRALEIFHAKGLTDAHLDAIQAVGLADAGKALTVMDGAGKNAADVQRLADEAKVALGGYYREFTFGQRSTIGWQPTCACDAGTVAGVVLDPFMGSGTTGLVARRLGRRFVGFELNPEYVAMANRRLAEPYTLPMFERQEATS